VKSAAGISLWDVFPIEIAYSVFFFSAQGSRSTDLRNQFTPAHAPPTMETALHSLGSRPLRKSRLLTILRAGGHAPCMKLNTIDPRVVEIAGFAGFPVVWLCNEHVPNDWLTLEQQIRAARVHDMDTVVRVAKGSYSDYVKPLEADATGLMIPHVTSAEEARQIVAWTRFHPLGSRPIDGGNADGRYCRAGIDAYLENGNRERFLILQIESPEGVENIDAIAGVEGFDILHFGPGDFCHRIGQAGNPGHPAALAARRRVAEAARKHGKFAMSQPIAPFRELAEEGYQVISVGADVMGLNEYMDAKLARFNQELGITQPQ
jgi:4-hydroxy-2-oxoheptanedioate aldolase